MQNIADIIDFIYIFIDNILTLYRIGIFDKWNNLRNVLDILRGICYILKVFLALLELGLDISSLH